MSETVSVCNIDSPFKVFPEDRAAFYEEQIAEYKKNGKPAKAVEVVNVFLFTPAGEILVQKRSSTKAHNPNLLDKSIGGHMIYGDRPYYTVMVETVQELQTPSIVVNTKDEFVRTLDLLKNYLDTIAVILYVDVNLVQLRRIIKDEPIVIGNKAHIFFGIYGGRTKPVDREAKGVLQYSFEEIEKEIALRPDQFTDDFIYYFNKYRAEIETFIQEATKA